MSLAVVHDLLCATADKRQALARRCVQESACEAVFAMVLRAGVDLTDAALLAEAAKANDLRFLSDLLRAGASPNVALSNGDSLLHLAPSAACVRLLLAHGAHVDAVNRNSETPLHLACAKIDHDPEGKMVALVFALLVGRPNVNLKDCRGRTPLHVQLTRDSIPTKKIVRALIDAGADVNAVDADGVAPLEVALSLQVFNDVAIILLDAGADALRPMAKIGTPFHGGRWILLKVELLCRLFRAGVDVNTVDEMGNTLLHIVVENHDICGGALGTLLLGGVRPDIANAAGETPMSLVLSRQSDQGMKNSNLVHSLVSGGANVETVARQTQQTALHKAVDWRNEHLLAALIDKFGANVNAVAKNGDTPLIAAAAAGAGAERLVSRLMAAGANVNLARQCDGATALHVAIGRGNRAVVALLIDGGADLHAADAKGFTPSHLAVALGDEELVCRLFNAGVNVNSTSAAGDSLLHLAAAVAAPETDSMLRVLVAAGGNVYAVNRRQETPCHVAARNAVALRALIAAGAAVNAMDERGRTPLHYAVVGEAKSSVDVLVAAGADVRFIDQTGSTLLHVCLANVRSPRPAFVRYLIALGIDVNAVDGNGQTASHLAARADNRACFSTLFGCGADVLNLPLQESCLATGQLMIAAGWTTTRRLSQRFQLLLAAAESDEACDVERMASARLELVRARGVEVCIGLQSMHLDALQLTEIIRCASAPASKHVPFHKLWAIAVTVKHWRTNRKRK